MERKRQHKEDKTNRNDPIQLIGIFPSLLLNLFASTKNIKLNYFTGPVNFYANFD